MMTIIYCMSIKYFMNIGLMHTAFPLNRNFHNRLLLFLEGGKSS